MLFRSLGGTEKTNWLSKTLNPSVLIAGWNTLAAEVHNQSPTNSDLGFDFELTGTAIVDVSPDLSLSTVEGSGGSFALAWPAEASYFSLFATTNLTPPVVWTQLTNLPVLISNEWRVTLPTSTNVQRYFRLGDLLNPLINVAQMLANGQATVTNTTIDLGPIGNVFDGNTNTLARTPAINPMVVTLSFTSAMQISKSRVYFLAGNNSWRVETANSVADLDSMSGTFSVPLDWQADLETGWRERSFAAPVICRAVRLKLQRLTGDNYVHLNEWQFFQ